MSVKPFSLKSFREYLSEGKIMASYCPSCKKVHLPPRPICPNCMGKTNKWRELKGEGIIKAYTTIHVPLTKMMSQAPYTVGVIEFDEGGSTSGLITDARETDRDLINLRVKAQIVKEGEDIKLCFKIES